LAPAPLLVLALHVCRRPPLVVVVVLVVEDHKLLLLVVVVLGVHATTCIASA
jgi:hypothetical protein